MKIFSFWPRKWFRFNIRGNNRGTTLAEVMIALLIIALVILGGGMFFFYGRLNIIREAHRRAALLVASQRLEALKAADWDDIALISSLSYQPYYITHSSGWALNLSETKETITVDNLSDAQMLTEAQYMDDDGMDDSYDYLKITVVVEWSDPATNRVSSTSLVGPP